MLVVAAPWSLSSRSAVGHPCRVQRSMSETMSGVADTEAEAGTMAADVSHDLEVLRQLVEEHSEAVYRVACPWSATLPSPRTWPRKL